MTRWAHTGLAAVVLGAVLCPLAYIAIGAYSGFGPALALITAPPLLLAIGWLLYRYLSRPAPTSAPPRAWWRAAEVLAWLLIAAFLVVISGYTLNTGLERLGLTCVLLLVTSVLAVPLVLWRGNSALLQRLKLLLPAGIACALLLVLLFAVAATAAAYLLQPPSLPG